MFPEKKLEPACLVPVSPSLYKEWLQNMVDEYKTRQANVGNIVANTTSSTTSSTRKKRSTFVRSDEFCATLEPRHGFYGINPKIKGNTLRAAIICQCDGEPWKRVRKQIKYMTCYSENMVDPNNEEFKDLKTEIETFVSFYTSKRRQ